MDNTDIFKIVLNTVLRHFLTGLAGVLITYGLTADQSTAFISASTAVLVSAVIFLATLGWSYASKWYAIHMEPPTQG
jgi:hypothetical protein